MEIFRGEIKFNGALSELFQRGQEFRHAPAMGEGPEVDGGERLDDPFPSLDVRHGKEIAGIVDAKEIRVGVVDIALQALDEIAGLRGGPVLVTDVLDEFADIPAFLGVTELAAPRGGAGAGFGADGERELPDV